MVNDSNYVELVGQAQQGDKEALNLLAETASVRLYEYVKRITLQEDLTQDIVQESVLEMFKVFGNLKKPERFWDWMEGIAFNKVRNHYGRKWRRKEVSLSDVGYETAGTSSSDGLADMVTAELKEIVVKSMHHLQPRQRAILTLRCYKGMKYAEIAKLMKCSEFGAQALFYRAKKALAKELSRCGFGKGSLLTALVIFGKMTATSEAAAANVTVTSAVTKVSLTAGLAGALGTKTAIVSLTTAGVLAVGGVVATSGLEKTAIEPAHHQAEPSSSVVAKSTRPASEASGEYWYYFPEGPGGPVMMQQTKKDHRQWLQDEHANYHYRDNTIYIENKRGWHRSLCVWRLPTDSPQLSKFISGVEGMAVEMERIESKQSHLLVVAQRDTKAAKGVSWVTRSNTALQEDYFQCDWPTGTDLIDNRDSMHKRCWTYFTVSGRINGKEVSGTGRVPFVYAASSCCQPWMRLCIGGEVFIDKSFTGLSRPWMGLHTIDTVRRDGAEREIPFQSSLFDKRCKGRVTLTTPTGEIVYTIDMERDLVETIEFAGQRQGQLNFTYLQDVSDIGSQFAQPRGRHNEQNIFEILEID